MLYKCNLYANQIKLLPIIHKFDFYLYTLGYIYDMSSIHLGYVENLNTSKKYMTRMGLSIRVSGYSICIRHGYAPLRSIDVT